MKRNRGVSNAARHLSTVTAEGIITDEQKLWLRSVLAEGDPAVEDALDQATMGNSQPLKNLVHSGNNALRARLESLSKDNEFQRLSYSRSQDGPNILDLEDLTEDLRFSTLSTIETPETILNNENSTTAASRGGDSGGTDDNGFDLEALLDEVTGMMTATTSPNTGAMTSTTGPLNSLDKTSSDLELDFTFGDEESENGDRDGASMISSSSDGGGGGRGKLSLRGSLMLAQMRARETSTGSRMMHDNLHGGSLTGIDDNDEGGFDSLNDGINLSIIDDYFVDESTTVSRGQDLDSIDRSMLAVLAQDDTFSPQQTKFKGNAYENISKNQIWSVEEPPPPPPPSASSGFQQQQQQQQQQKGFQPQQPFYSPFMFGSCVGGANNNQQNNGTSWNGPASHTGSSPMMGPAYGSPTGTMMPGAAGGGGGWQQQPASWTAGMDPLQVLQLQHRAQVMQRNGMVPGPMDHHFMSDTASTHSNGSSGSNKRGRVRMNELCNRFDMIQNRLNLTSQQRELVFLVLNRDDRFLTKQFDTAISDAEKGRPQQLIGLIQKAESMSTSLKEVSALTTSLQSNSSNNSSLNGAASPTSSQSSTANVVPPLSPEEEESFQFQSTLASAQAACASLDIELLEEHENILKELVLLRKTSAVTLRDAKQFDGALKVMKELKQAQGLLDTCQKQIAKARSLSPTAAVVVTDATPDEPTANKQMETETPT